MITSEELNNARNRAREIISRTGLTIRQGEIEEMEVVDFGLCDIEQSGAQILTLVDTERITVKLLAMLPNQVEPEHRHPQLDDYLGKEETIRCEWGELYLYGPGEPTPDPKGHPPEDRKDTYTVWHEYILLPGEQVTFQPDTPHWFQGGPEGAVFWSFSTKAIDVKDIFTDPDIRR
jgi:D-lyxose ketol-isomerase